MQLPNNTVPSESNFLAPFFAGAGKSSAAAEALTSVGVPAGEGKFDQLFDGLKGSPKQPGTTTPAEMAGLGFVVCPMPFVPVAPAEEPVVLTESGVVETEGSSEDGESPVAGEVSFPAGLSTGKAIGHNTRDSRITARSAKTAAQSEKDAVVGEGEDTADRNPAPASDSSRTISQPNEHASDTAFQTPRFTGLPETAIEHRQAAQLPTGLTRLMTIHAPVTSTSETPAEVTTPDVSTDTADTIPSFEQETTFGSHPTVWPGASVQNHAQPFPSPSGSVRHTSDLAGEPVLGEQPTESLDLGALQAAREELLASDRVGQDLGQAMRSLNHARGLETPNAAEDLAAEADVVLSVSPETPRAPVQGSQGSEKRTLPETSKLTAKIADAAPDSPVDTNTEADKSFVGANKERVTLGRKHVGTDVAKQGADMFSRFLPTAAQPSASDHAGSVVAALENVSESALHGETVPVESVNTAHEAVEVVLKTVEQASNQEQKSVNLRFSVGDVDLSVRVELHANQVRTTFRTDSPELRAALSQEWEAVASNTSGERTLKHVPAFVTASENSSLNSFSGDTSSRQRDHRAEREANERAVRVTSKSRGPAAATPVASTNAGISGLAPVTSRRLHTVA
jgi:hypothetical protein